MNKFPTSLLIWQAHGAFLCSACLVHRHGTIDACLPHRAILTGERKVTMTGISWIHDPDTGIWYSWWNFDIMRSIDSRIKREKSPKEAIWDLRYARSRKSDQ
jgi:hypothetical protein